MKQTMLVATILVVVFGASTGCALTPLQEAKIGAWNDCKNEVHPSQADLTRMDARGNAIRTYGTSADSVAMEACMDAKGFGRVRNDIATPSSAGSIRQPAQIRADFDVCKEQSQYWTARLTEVTPDGQFRYEGDDPVGKKALVACLRAKGYRAN